MIAPVNALLEKEMDRKDFLKHIGIGMLMVAGGGMIMQSLQNAGKLSFGNAAQKSSQAYGYGSSVYGGNNVNA